MNTTKTGGLLTQSFSFSIGAAAPFDSGAVGSYTTPILLPSNACIVDLRCKITTVLASAGNGQVQFSTNGNVFNNVQRLDSDGAAGNVLWLIDTDLYSDFPVWSVNTLPVILSIVG